MEEITVEGAAEGYVEILHRYGVDYIFISPGSEFVPIWEYLVKYNSQGKKPFYINARHEGLALTMAKGYTMATSRTQVVMTHVLTGMLHGAMELKAMYTDNVPVMLIVGQNRTHDREVYGGTPGPHYLSFTEVGGQQRLIQPYLKWTDSPDSNKNILSMIARGLDIASTDVKGPVMMVLSRELLFEKVERMRVPHRTPRPTPVQADPSALKELSKMLVKAQNPIIYTRYLGRNPAAVSSLVELAELISIPVFETPGYMNFPTGNPLHMGYDVKSYVAESDLILVIDASGWPPWYPPNSISETSKAKIVFIDLDPLQLKYSVYGYPADLLITGDSSLAIPSIIEDVKEIRVSKDLHEERLDRWKAEHRRIREAWRKEASATKDQCPIDPRWLCLNINEVVNEDTIIVHETISHSGVVHKFVERNRIEPGTQFESTGPVAHTGLGQGLGVALGVKLACTEKTVIALEGDGSFNYNPVSACLGLSQEYGLPFLIVIFDNLGYASMKHHQIYYPKGYSVSQGRYYGVYTKPKPAYDKLAEVFGGYAETVTDPGEVKPALLRALDEVGKGRLALLDVILPES